jgi:hypothetical protein
MTYKRKVHNAVTSREFERQLKETQRMLGKALRMIAERDNHLSPKWEG